MWIKQIEIDGYGIFSGFSLAPLAPGLNIFCGPNESGKTTLRDFITCILLGFDSQSSARDFRRPLRGGEHGGRLLIVSDDGAEYVVSRHTTKKNTAPPIVLNSSGRQVDEKVLAALMRHLSKKSYTNYFAIGLDELKAFDSLQGTEMEAWLYKAGFSGRGRSVVHILKECETARGQLFKTRGKGKISELVSELDSLQQAIAKLQERPQHYQELLARESEIIAEITAKEALLRTKRSEQARLAKLLEIWPDWEYLQQLEANLPDRPRQQELQQLVDLRDQITGLERGLDLFLQNLAALEESVLTLRTMSERIADLQAELGSDRTPAELLTLPTGRTLEMQAAAIARQVQEAETLKMSRENAVAQCVRVLRERENQVRQLQVELEHLVGSADEKIPEVDEAALEEISRLQQELDTLALHLEANEAQLRLMQRLQGNLYPWLIGGLLGAGLLWVDMLIGSAIIVMALVGLAVTFGRRQRSRLEVQACLAKSRSLSEQRETVESRLRELSQLVAGKEMLSTTELAELKRASDRQAEGRKILRQLGQARERLTEAEQELQLAEQALAKADVQLKGALDSWQRFLMPYGLSAELAMDGFMSFLASLRQLQDYQRQYLTEQERQSQIQQRITSYLVGLNQIHEGLGLPSVREPALVAKAVSALTRRLAEALQELARLEEYATLKERLRIACGISGDQWAELQSELASYQDHVLQAEIAQLTRLIQELEAELDRLKSERGSVGLEIRQLEAEQELALLRTKEALKQEELERAAVDWLKWTVLQFALTKAKQRYEEERQPEVFTLASQYFALATQERYTRVYTPVDKEGVLVQTADLQRLDAAATLSRGTAEVLYLCLRLALARKVVQDGESLPLLFDDVLVNLDQTRFKQVVKLLGQVAENCQVLFFTCHPEVALALAEQCDDCQLWWLADGKLVESWDACFAGAASPELTG